MTSLLQRAISRNISTIDDFIEAFSFAGNQYTLLSNTQQTLTGDRVEQPGSDTAAFARSLYATHGVVHGCMALRSAVFSTVRLVYQDMIAGRPSGLIATPALDIFTEPWPGGTTQQLLAQMIEYVDWTGNSYVVRDRDLVREETELVPLEPTWVKIVLQRRASGLGYRKIGILYSEGGVGVTDPVFVDIRDVAHFIDRRDPFAPWRGMSWLRSVFTEVANDRLMERHKTRTFEQGATPNLVVKTQAPTDTPAGSRAFREFVAKFRAEHEGAENAGRTLMLSDGADVEVVGRDLQQMTFKQLQGHAETRIALAAGVPAVILGISEGLAGSSLNTGNYGAARRRFADATMHPLWMNVGGTLAPLVRKRPGARMWYDTRDVPFVREDEADIATIQQTRSNALRALVDAGYTAASAKAALESDDFGLLQHSGLFSVQLQPAGAPNGNGPQPAQAAANGGGS